MSMASTSSITAGRHGKRSRISEQETPGCQGLWQIVQRETVLPSGAIQSKRIEVLPVWCYLTYSLTPDTSSMMNTYFHPGCGKAQPRRTAAMIRWYGNGK